MTSFSKAWPKRTQSSRPECTPFHGAGGLDGYAYANNSPMNFFDPTGHVPCDEDGENCSLADINNYHKQFYIDMIKDKYHWEVQGDWNLDEIKTIYQTGSDIEKYVDSLTNGKGINWMNKYLGDISFAHASDSPFYFLLGDRGSALPNQIFLPDLQSGRFGNPSTYIAHELAHIWDRRTSSSGFVGGVGDNLNDFMGGTNIPFLPRWINIGNDPRVSKEYLFTVNNGYGNGCTADYLAETFAWSIYGSQFVPGAANQSIGPGNVWINVVISLEAGYLP